MSIMTGPADSPRAAPGPTPPSERILTLDALHGLALLGVLLVELPLCANPILSDQLPGLRPEGAAWEVVLARGIELFARTKFLTVFTILFGASFALLESRAKAAGADFVGPYRRRMAVLLLIGVLQTVFAWHSIIPLYAVVGLLVLPARRWSTRAVLLAVVGLEAANALLAAAGIVGAAERGFAMPQVWAERFSAHETQVYTAGTWGQVAALRLATYAALLVPTTVALFGLRSVGLVLLGISLFRAGLFRETEDQRPLLKRMAVWGLAAGLPLELLAQACRGPSPVQAMLRWCGVYGGGLALAVGYIGLVSLLCLGQTWRRLAGPLAAVGRACLSNYVLATGIGAVLVYPYGLGLFGRLSPGPWALISTLLFAVLAASSWAWLGRLRFGPLEWLVRGFSYGRFPRLRAGR